MRCVSRFIDPNWSGVLLSELLVEFVPELGLLQTSITSTTTVCLGALTLTPLREFDKGVG